MSQYEETLEAVRVNPPVAAAWILYLESRLKLEGK